MDVEKLIERLEAWNEQHLSVVCGSGHFACDYLCESEDCIVVQAATALSTLQAESEQLRAELEQERAHRLHAEKHADAFLEDCKRLNAELENYRKGHCSEGGCAAEKDRDAVLAELEQVKAERDAAVSWAQKYTESIDRPCVACKQNTGDYVCTEICGNCGPMGTESCKWEFDFSGELKED